MSLLNCVESYKREILYVIRFRYGLFIFINIYMHFGYILRLSLAR